MEGGAISANLWSTREDNKINKMIENALKDLIPANWPIKF